MTAVTAFPWRLQLAEMPHPAPLSVQDWSAVTLGRCVGLNALEHMLADGLPVGPVLVCNAHLTVHIPVLSRYGDGPITLHTRLRLRSVSCPDTRFGYGPCPGRFWMLPAVTGDQVLTDFPNLFHSLHRARCAGSRAA